MRLIAIAWLLTIACSPDEPPGLRIDAGIMGPNPIDSCEMILPECALFGPCTANDDCCSRTCLPSGQCEGSTPPCSPSNFKCVDRDTAAVGPCCSRACDRGTCAPPLHGLSDECGGFDVCGTANFPHLPDCEPCIAAVCALEPFCCSGWALECSCWLRRVCPSRCPG